MIATKRCWWCGKPAEVDTSLPESGGMIKDSDSSWLCKDNAACVQRASAAMAEPGYQRNKGAPETTAASGTERAGDGSGQ